MPAGNDQAHEEEKCSTKRGRGGFSLNPYIFLLTYVPCGFMLEGLFSKLESFLAGRPVHRSEPEQQAVDGETKRLSLYHYSTCPFCLSVRRVIKKLNLKIDLRNVRRDPEYRKELMLGGGMLMVPCLRIEDREGKVRWLYESTDINRYLIERFSPKANGN